MRPHRGRHCAIYTVLTRWTVLALAAVACVLAASSCANDPRATALDQRVLLVPHVNAGWAGWCMIRINREESGCPAAPSNPPIIAETWESSNSPTVTVGYAITTSQVSSVMINGGPRIPTHTEVGLPDGLHAIVVEIPGLNLEHDEALPRFVPLSAKGDRISQSPGRRRELDSEILASEVLTNPVIDPTRPVSGVCRISQGHLRGLTAKSGSVITSVKSYSGLIGEGYISCASTAYDLNGWPLLACVLLSAAHPGATPGLLPDMEPLAKHPGIFGTPGPEGSQPEQALFVRRINGGWLVVARAKPQQRLALLEHLQAVVHM